MPRVILMGAPGSGKGTQGEVLAQAWSVPRLAPGDIFREHIRRGTPLGLEVKSYSDAGKLVPDGVVIRVMGERLADAQAGWILDGFPRTVPQATALDELLTQLHQPCDGIVNLDVPEEILVGRLLQRAQEQNRTDDTPAVIQNRLQEYYDKTQPLLDFYGERVIRIDGTQAVPQVTAQIQTHLAVT
ncbi:adenylate kinase [Gloeomargarita lithophora Alchichica-D10]|uniref:Adenylate kinase n=1 Tax=Gloeomargarita lithophora Alchichica-D10 TaxID=1188229 RepID=A0A1J0AEN7_9CYAN|nr:adenylate kinase [Gloeomargarita lithophora]APB34414.1 adenylate kinase [Gloeomargarita lithophora Alchichica-D10]